METLEYRRLSLHGPSTGLRLPLQHLQPKFLITVVLPLIWRYYGFDSIAFSFTSSEPATTLRFECSVDGGSFATCTSPDQINGLSEGGHTFQVRVVDIYGNVGVPSSVFTWTVDRTAPTVATLTAKVPDNSGTSINSGATTGFDSIAFSFTSSEPVLPFALSVA